MVSCRDNIFFSILIFFIRLSMYLVSTIPSSPSVYPYMGSYISILFYSILNIWGAHYHSRVVHFLWIYLLSEFQSPSSKIVVFGILVFLWIHFLPGFQSPVSKRFLFGLLVSANTFIGALDGGCWWYVPWLAHILPSSQISR